MRLSQQYSVNIGGEMKPLPTEEFVNQKVGEAIGKIGQTVFRLKTPLAPQQPNHRRAEYIMERSAQNYSRNATSGKTWEAGVKREAPKLLPPVSQEDRSSGRQDAPPIDPGRIF
jgi:hypothetical protein